MLSKLVAVFALTAYVVYAQTTTLNLPVTQDFAVANNGFSGAQVSRPDVLSFFNNGFQSSVSYFGIDLSPLASFDTSTISSATLTFTNFTLSRDSQASIAITLLNYGQVFDESTVSLNTQPTSQGTLGTVLFNSATGVATIEVQNQLKAAQTAGGLFGIRVDPPGGPITVASHRVNPNAVYIAVVFGGATSAPVTTTTTTAAPTSGPTTTTTTAAPAPGAPSTAAPVPGAPSTARVTTTTTTAAPGSPTTTTTRSPTAGPTSSFAPSSAPTTPGAPSPSTTEAPRSSANKISAALLCIVPLAMALLL